MHVKDKAAQHQYIQQGRAHGQKIAAFIYWFLAVYLIASHIHARAPRIHLHLSYTRTSHTRAPRIRAHLAYARTSHTRTSHTCAHHHNHKHKEAAELTKIQEKEAEEVSKIAVEIFGFSEICVHMRVSLALNN